MKQVIIEYAGMAISLVGAIGFLVLTGLFFLGSRGLFASLITFVLGGL